MIRYLWLTCALAVTSFSLASAIYGSWGQAHVGAVIALVALAAGEVPVMCRRRTERLRRERDHVWARRHAEQQDHVTLNELFEDYERLWEERKPVATTVVYGPDGEPIHAYNSRGQSAAVSPTEVGAPPE